MGYRREPKTYKLIFEDPEMAGLEVVARSLSVRELAKLMGYTDVARPADAPEAGNAETAAAMVSMFEVLGKSLVSWNLEDELGGPVPADFDGICTQEPDFVFAIVNAWIEAISEVAPPLPGGSPSGAAAREASLGLASSSLPLPS